MTSTNNAIRKAAILVSTLDADSADRLLEQMGEVRAQRVRTAIMSLGDVPEAEQQEVLAQFLAGPDGRPPEKPAAGGVELELSETATNASRALTERTSTGASGDSNLEAQSSSLFRRLRDADASRIAEHLESEHPQTAALVLANVSPNHAAEILAHFTPAMQVEVLHRVAHLDAADAEVLRAVESGLMAALEEPSSQQHGIAAVSAILHATNETVGDHLRSQLCARDKGLSSKLDACETVRPADAPVAEVPFETDSEREPSDDLGDEESDWSTAHEHDISPQVGPQLDFTDFARMDDRALAEVLRQTDPEVMLVALAGATPDLVERLARHLGRRDARRLRSGIEKLGPLRLRDVERAQQKMTNVANDLLQRGMITAPARRVSLAA